VSSTRGRGSRTLKNRLSWNRAARCRTILRWGAMQLPDLHLRLELAAAALCKPDADRFAERSCAALVPGGRGGGAVAVLPNSSGPELTLEAAQPAARQSRVESHRP